MRPKTLPAKALWVLRNRPTAVLRSVREYALFRRTALLMPLFGQDRSLVELGTNVRVQKLRCLVAEKPNAKIVIGDHSILYERAEVGAYGEGRIELGACSILGDARIFSRFHVKIGKRFMGSWNVFIQDFDSHPVTPEDRRRQVETLCARFRPRYGPVPFTEEFPWRFTGKPIEIGDDVWVGANSTIFKGVRIGNGCIVASGAVVVAGDYPDRSIIAGNPARVVAIKS